MHDGFRLIFDHFDDHFDGGLEAPRHAGGGAARGQPHDQAADHAHRHRPQDRVEVPDVEIDHERLGTLGEVAQVVLDIFACGWRMLRRGFYRASHCLCPNNKMM